MKKNIIIVIAVLLVIVLAFVSFKDSEDEINLEVDEKILELINSDKYEETEETSDYVKIDVKDFGSIIAILYPDVAPITVSNFKKLVSEGFYNGITFHRVINDFMIQCGDPTGTGIYGSEETIKGEFKENGFKNVLSHTRGVLSMARKGAEVETSETYNSASSQFFIVQKDSTYLDGKYASFGRVLKGIEIVDEIVLVDTDNSDKPINDVVIDSIKFIKLSE